MDKIKVAILGSTGSIGTQTLDVIEKHSELFEVELLTANNSAELLIEQAIKFQPNNVVICNHDKYKEVSEALLNQPIKVFSGINSVCDLVKGDNVDIVVAAMVGFSGLKPTLAALNAGKNIALANKETLVAAGSIVKEAALKNNCAILPVDSEHSAIFQAIQGERSNIEKILLTASGGPFLNSSIEEIRNASLKEALNHPRWKMGAKVTIDSASMMNKGLEMIEAKWLFDISPDKIEIVVHPESIIHSMVQFEDGSVMAQLSNPDMRLPIQYALSYPYRLPLNTKRLDFSKIGALHFQSPDFQKFPALRIAYESIKKGGNIPCAMNSANEVAVQALRDGKIAFWQIPLLIERCLEKCHFIQNPTLDDIYSTDFESKKISQELVKNLYKW